MTYHTQQSILYLGMPMLQPQLVYPARNQTRVSRVHVPAMMVRRQLYSGIERLLQISLGSVRLEQLDERLGAELRFEAPLERVFGFVFVMQPERQFTEDFPLIISSRTQRKGEMDVPLCRSCGMIGVAS